MAIIWDIDVVLLYCFQRHRYPVSLFKLKGPSAYPIEIGKHLNIHMVTCLSFSKTEPIIAVGCNDNGGATDCIRVCIVRRLEWEG